MTETIGETMRATVFPVGGRAMGDGQVGQGHDSRPGPGVTAGSHTLGAVVIHWGVATWGGN